MLTLGAIADDFTGATDLANNLARGGLRVEQWLGLPEPGDEPDDAQAVVVALKSRTAPATQAVSESLAAARWLRTRGARQLYFKVCSTFDSTPQGNIGPVAEALAAFVEAPIVPVTPAFPENGRSVYMGHLFVDRQLLSDSPMRQHPLTPMTDANLLRVLQAQLRHGCSGLLEYGTVQQGAAAARERLLALRADGVTMAVVDAITDADLHVLADAVHEFPLVVAGSGLAIGLPRHHGCAPGHDAARLPQARGAAAILAGSCSAATQAQVAQFIGAGGAALALDPLRAAAGEDLVGEALQWAQVRLGDTPVLIYATSSAERVQEVQARLGVARAGALVEDMLARIATSLVDRGVGRLVVAGGETSGACLQALGLRRLRIGMQIDPGVPWCHAPAAGLHVALKSGNFGAIDFFSRAFAALGH